MLQLYIGKQLAEVKIFKFPAGESGVSFHTSSTISHVGTGKIPAMITLKWESNDDIINLALLVDAIRRQYVADLSLNIPYFPYARQDRVCNVGESLSVKVIADIINSMEFTNVYVTDPHSDVVGALVNNLIVMSNSANLSRAFDAIKAKEPFKSIYLVSPDAGANKKVLSHAKDLGGAPMIRADKTRDTKTGTITGTVVYSEHIGNSSVLVIDDILDGGGTFIPLAKELRKITDGSVNLLVTHGIFTKGVDIFEGVYDNIFVVNNMFGTHPLIKEI